MSIAGPSNAAGHGVARAAGTRAAAGGALGSAPPTPSTSETDNKQAAAMYEAAGTLSISQLATGTRAIRSASTG